MITNIQGMNSETVREFLHRTRGTPYERLGEVVNIASTDIVKIGDDGKRYYNPMFFPHYCKGVEVIEGTLVQPGDMVVLDEAWHLFPAGERMHPNHLSFFAEHGHFVHPQTGVACDLVFMTQAMELVHRNLKAMCAFIFETHRKAMFGKQGAKTYSVNMWEGNKATRTAKCGNWVRQYDPEIFKLYKSFASDTGGQLATIDARQNVLKSWKAWGFIAGTPILIGISIWAGLNAYESFVGKPVPKKTAQGVASVSDSATAASPATAPGTAKRSSLSTELRVVGTVSLNGDYWVVVSDTSGTLRYESPGYFVGRGVFTVGSIDGQRVAAFTGIPAKSSGASLLGGNSK